MDQKSHPEIEKAEKEKLCILGRIYVSLFWGSDGVWGLGEGWRGGVPLHDQDIFPLIKAQNPLFINKQQMSSFFDIVVFFLIPYAIITHAIW